MYEKKDIEVLILDDEIDEIVISSVPKYDEKELKSVNLSGAADDFSDYKDESKEEDLKPVLKKIKNCIYWLSAPEVLQCMSLMKNL